MPGFKPSAGSKAGGTVKSAGKRARLTGGHWVSIHGHPVYLKDGNVARGGKVGLTHDAAGRPAGGRPLTAPHDMILDGRLHRQGDPIRPDLYRRAPREMRRAIDEGCPAPPPKSGAQVVAVRHADRVTSRADGPTTTYSPGTKNFGFSGAVVEGGVAHALVGGRRAFPLNHAPGEDAAHGAARRYAELKGDRAPGGPEQIRTARPSNEIADAAKHHGFNPHQPGDYAWVMGHKADADKATARDNADRSRRAVRDFKDEARLAGLDWKIGKARPSGEAERSFAEKAAARGKIPVVVTATDRGGKPETERVAVDHVGQVFDRLNRIDIRNDPAGGQAVRIHILTAARDTPGSGFRPKGR